MWTKEDVKSAFARTRGVAVDRVKIEPVIERINDFQCPLDECYSDCKSLPYVYYCLDFDIIKFEHCFARLLMFNWVEDGRLLYRKEFLIKEFEYSMPNSQHNDRYISYLSDVDSKKEEGFFFNQIMRPHKHGYTPDEAEIFIRGYRLSLK